MNANSINWTRFSTLNSFLTRCAQVFQAMSQHNISIYYQMYREYKVSWLSGTSEQLLFLTGLTDFNLVLFFCSFSHPLSLEPRQRRKPKCKQRIFSFGSQIAVLNLWMKFLVTAALHSQPPKSSVSARKEAEKKSAHIKQKVINHRHINVSIFILVSVCV